MGDGWHDRVARERGLHGWCAWLGLALLMGLVASPPSVAIADDARQGRWSVEMGPYVGYYDFDSSVAMEDHPLFGARICLSRSELFAVEAEFDEVYTRREVTNHAARQVSLSLHGRWTPWLTRLRPGLLAGVAFVMFDDADDTDGFSEAYDLGLGLGYRLNDRWTARADWFLRHQNFSIYTADEESPAENIGMWGRAFRVGVFHAF